MAGITVSNTGGNWSATSSWVGNVGPGSSDTVIYTNTSGNIVVDTNSASCGGIDFTNGTSLFTCNGTNKLIIFAAGGGSFKFATTATYTGTGTIEFQGNGGTLTSNGVFWSGSVEFGSFNAASKTLADAWVVGGDIIWRGNNSTTCTVNGNSITCYGNLRKADAASNPVTLSGTTTFTLAGNGYISTQPSSSGSLVSNPITITGNYTFLSNENNIFGCSTFQNNGVLTPGAGSTLTINSTGTYNNLQKSKFPNVSITAGTTITMNYFFVGTDDTITNITSSSTNYNITINAGTNCVSPFIKVANCTLTRPGSVYSTYKNSNKGGNVGIIFANPMGNTFPQQLTTHTETMLTFPQQGMRGWIVNT